jgi:tetratricopeptide (TPR) repeat protein
MQSFRKFIVLYRLPIAIALIALGVLLTMQMKHGIYVSWLFFLIAILMIVAHFMLGPITLMQQYMESGDLDGAKALLSKVKYPNLLYKPLRSAYYMLQSNFSTMNENFDDAEINIRKSIEAGSNDKMVEGGSYLQLGMIAYRKGNKKEAKENIRKALSIGLPDKDSEASAYLQLCSIAGEQRDFKSMKIYFQKAKACKAKNQEIANQIKEMDKYISRIPG